jgi:hypothetical protein
MSQVHAETARRADLNPSVRTPPAPRRRSPSLHAAWSAILLMGSAGAAAYLANDGHEQSLAISVALAALFAGGIGTAVTVLVDGGGA